jgi:hypothetical protein
MKLTAITPSLAASWLAAQHPRQRKPNWQWVGVLSSRIVSGKWDPHAGVICRHEGLLTDGAHRLEAIVASGITVECAVIDKPWSKYRDDTRRRSCADRNGVDKSLSGAARLAGRIVGIIDPDAALESFGRAIEDTGLTQIAHVTPWHSSAVIVGAFAAEVHTGVRSKPIIDRVIACQPESEHERRMCVRASKGGIATTGSQQIETAVYVFACCSRLTRASVEALRSALLGKR